MVSKNIYNLLFVAVIFGLIHFIYNYVILNSESYSFTFLFLSLCGLLVIRQLQNSKYSYFYVFLFLLIFIAYFISPFLSSFTEILILSVSIICFLIGAFVLHKENQSLAKK